MVDNTLALRGANPPINALGNFQQGQEAARLDETHNFKMAAATMEMIGSGAMYAMNGDINGEVDPTKYAEVLDSFQQMGIDTTKFRSNPNFAKIAAQASITALDRIKIAQNEKEFELAMAKFEQDLAQASQPKAPNIETVFDEQGRDQKVVWDPATKAFVPIGGAKGEGAKAPEVQTFFDENGAEQKMQWDGEKRVWTPVGGAKASDPKPPSIQTIYDEAGKERKVQWDGTKKAWVPIGGTKADSRKAPSIQTIYSENGREQKVQWDDEKGAYVPIGSEKAPTGTSLTVGKDGEVTFEQGEGVGLGKAATNDVQDRAIKTSELGSRLSTVARDFKPEYQTVGTKFANWWRSGKASIDPKLLDPAEKQSLSDFATYRSSAVENLSAILKDMSGAAVTAQEYERIRSYMPDAGTGVLDGDDPVTFQAKLTRAMEEADKALARYEFYQVSGLPGSLDEIPLSNIKKIDGDWYVKKGDKVFKIGERPEEPE